jgi:hypothetical protein
MKGDVMQGNKCTPVAPSAAGEVEDRINNITGRLQELKEKIANKLESVTNPICEAPQCEEKDGRSFPPLFSRLRAEYIQQQKLIADIHEILDHLEL